MRLLWLDLETTGLQPHDGPSGQILEVGAFLTDTSPPWARVQRKEVSFVLPFDLDAWRDRIDANVIEMHEKSGLKDACLEQHQNLDSRGLLHKEVLRLAESSVLALLGDVKDYPEAVPLAGSSVHFDLAWVRYHMPRLAARLSYRVYDVSAVELFCRALGMPKKESPYKPHRALAELRNSLKHAEDLYGWLETLTSKEAQLPLVAGMFEGMLASYMFEKTAALGAQAAVKKAKDEVAHYEMRHKEILGRCNELLEEARAARAEAKEARAKERERCAEILLARARTLREQADETEDADRAQRFHLIEQAVEQEAAANTIRRLGPAESCPLKAESSP